MPELTLESLAKRVEELERKLAEQQSASPKDWRSVVGMFDDSEVMQEVIAAGRSIREADRRDAQQGQP